MFCLSPSPGLPVYNTQYSNTCKVFFLNIFQKFIIYRIFSPYMLYFFKFKLFIAYFPKVVYMAYLAYL